MGLYDKPRRPRHRSSCSFCHLVLAVVFMTSLVAVVIPWLMATGVIDPDSSTALTDEAGSNGPKEGRRLDLFNKVDADIKEVEKNVVDLVSDNALENETE